MGHLVTFQFLSRPNMKRQKVLIIDDEPSIVRLVAVQLEPEEGDVFAYDTEAFTDPHAALERARTQPFVSATSFL